MKKIIFVIATILLFSFISTQSVHAIGMITEPIVVKDILRGQETSATLSLLNSEDKEVTYGLKAEGQVADWADFYSVDDKNFENPITEIKMPAKKYVNVNVKFKVPEDAPNGEYTGEVLVFLTSSGEIKSDESAVSVSQQIGLDVAITVTDKETVHLTASFIPSTYDVQKGKPLKIRVLYDNQGNVAVKPDLQLKIIKEGTAVYNAIFPYPEGEEAARAYAIREISPIEWQTTGQGNGRYRAELKVFLNGEEIQSKSFGFTIGYFQDSVWVSAISFIGGGSLGIRWVVLGAILLVIAASLYFLGKKGVNFAKAKIIFSNLRRLF